MKNYHKSYVHSERLITEHQRISSETYFYILYNLFHLGKNKELFIRYKEYQQLLIDKMFVPDFHHEYIELIEKFVRGENKKFIEAKLIVVYELTMKSSGSTELKLLILDWIIDYYKQDYNYRKINSYLIAKNNILAQKR